MVIAWISHCSSFLFAEINYKFSVFQMFPSVLTFSVVFNASLVILAAEILCSWILAASSRKYQGKALKILSCSSKLLVNRAQLSESFVLSVNWSIFSVCFFTDWEYSEHPWCTKHLAYSPVIESGFLINLLVALKLGLFVYILWIFFLWLAAIFRTKMLIIQFCSSLTYSSEFFP